MIHIQDQCSIQQVVTDISVSSYLEDSDITPGLHANNASKLV